MPEPSTATVAAIGLGGLALWLLSRAQGAEASSGDGGGDGSSSSPFFSIGLNLPGTPPDDPPLGPSGLPPKGPDGPSSDAAFPGLENWFNDNFGTLFIGTALAGAAARFIPNRKRPPVADTPSLGGKQRPVQGSPPRATSPPPATRRQTVKPDPRTGALALREVPGPVVDVQARRVGDNRPHASGRTRAGPRALLPVAAVTPKVPVSTVSRATGGAGRALGLLGLLTLTGSVERAKETEGTLAGAVSRVFTGKGIQEQRQKKAILVDEYGSVAGTGLTALTFVGEGVIQTATGIKETVQHPIRGVQEIGKDLKAATGAFTSLFAGPAPKSKKAAPAPTAQQVENARQTRTFKDRQALARAFQAGTISEKGFYALSASM